MALQNSCRQQPYWSADTHFPTDNSSPNSYTNSASSYNSTSRPLAHPLPVNPLTTSSGISHAHHTARQLQQAPCYPHHHGEHTIHHTPAHISAHAHQLATTSCHEGLRSDFPHHGLGRPVDYGKPLSISTNLYNNFPGTQSSFSFHH